MAVPPPDEYRTSYDLPLLEEPTLAIRPNPASLQFTEYSLALYYLSTSLNLDATTFQQSGYLAEIGNELPYGPREFLAIITRYYCIALQQHDMMQKRHAKRPTLRLQLDPTITWKDLDKKITEQLKAVLRIIRSLANELGKHYHEDIIPQFISDLSQLESAPPVANISVRECRMWCQVNTTEFRRRLQTANGSTELRAAMDEISGMITGDVVTVPSPCAFRIDGKGVESIVTPYVYFVCTGMDKDGNKVHNLVHVGCTRERHNMWKMLQGHRDQARDDLIGQEAINAWGNLYGQLVQLGVDRSEGTFQLREDLMQGNSQELPVWARGMVTNKLRACANHVGQSFRQVNWNQAATMGCCFICKTAISFEEVENKDFHKEARCISLQMRRDCPHSCAEVATSGPFQIRDTLSFRVFL
ncbi:unnamed protein product [Clonostachys rhizophaga]|uniref:Uncharacterized protein n=1 Tax=Clonostachys rhizophaga TaxID=160324 RepID=A0A9N9YSU5_9HYPO|nr:unnamed protein product [Clonostachys rhizophaga]